ncbi:MAG: hypothetical protein CBB67_006305 [Alteromonadaceae bacterium TMED7]|uniref:hypothetical protein n=1 Tax=Alteromonas sp. TaxID=232 RepID=UPI000B713A90|nr:hypothetical protein [Alteromonas sp.]MAI37440.1 hypothetical protein [Alteromonas sp.]RPH20326.1 MAG: hypothetical protein CBB67_006305 [Alteromonadaceae bacterium TMED7]|tara:strand:- start:39 stop:224 length:186 start_codon:yes stop_codon:yes gene_type:complete
MDSVTHTFLAWGCILVAYVVGHYFGEKKGSMIGAAVVLEWVEEKVGSVQFNAWMKQDREQD